MQSSGKALIVAYPYWGFAQGSTYTMFSDFYSPQLHNIRDISVYVPASLQQNNISRSVHVLIVNDGTLFYTSQLAFPGGFDRAVLSGAVPETIMIGLPQNGTSCERQYELTFSQTIRDLSCTQSGGSDVYFDFIQQTVVPAVLAQLNLTLASVSMAGVSYGGLTSCYAASARPQYFSRVFCQSPSTWWNYGQLNQVIGTNALNMTNGTGLPSSVSFYIGTIEMEVPQCANAACSVTIPWFDYVNDTLYAFLAAGVPASSLFFYTLNGRCKWAGVPYLVHYTKPNTYRASTSATCNYHL